ncbi:MAG: substrate-binding domain-containing protein [Candidatus Heimdallarchaeota archaeon]
MDSKTRIWVFITSLIVISGVSATYFLARTPTAPDELSRLVVATTTSLYDTGLLDSIEDVFETEYPIKLYFIATGTGLAINHAKRGDADMILVHAPTKERAFLEEGYGVCRKIITYNFFTIVGPSEDPAQIKNLPPIEALTKIIKAGQQEEVIWVSRGDDSGTHSKEKQLWASTGYNWDELKEETWFVESGTGMGKTLQITNEYRGYTLVDMGTYLKYSIDKLIELDALVRSGKELLNVYSAIMVNPTVNPSVNDEGAIAFIKFLVSEEGQQLVSEYGKNIYPEFLFYPVVGLLKTQNNPMLVSWIEDIAYIEGSECPPAYWDAHPELYE